MWVRGSVVGERKGAGTSDGVNVEWVSLGES